MGETGGLGGGRGEVTGAGREVLYIQGAVRIEVVSNRSESAKKKG